MASNFDFLKNIDNELFDIVQDGEKLFRDEYFNQSVVQFRIYAEKMAKKILNSDNSELTFDTVLNNLKDKIKTQREKEFIDDLFFIKKEGNACAHGEDATAITTLEVIKRAFEAGINYAYTKTKNKTIDSLIFDETLLITLKPKEKEPLVEKYLKLAQSEDTELSKENLLNQKQGEFMASVDKSTDENNIKDKNRISNPNQYTKKKKKELSPKEQKIKQKVKEARKNIKENINNENKRKEKTPKKEIQKQKKNPVKKTSKKTSKKNESDFIKALLFVIFVLISVYLILKMII